MRCKNVIYVMKCRSCEEEYIGETGNFLRKRVTVHNQHIRDPKTRVSEQFNSCANLLEPKYNIFPFYKMYTDREHYDGQKNGQRKNGLL